MNNSKPLSHYIITADHNDDLFEVNDYLDKIRGLHIKKPNDENNHVWAMMNQLYIGRSCALMKGITNSLKNQDLLLNDKKYPQFIESKSLEIKQKSLDQYKPLPKNPDSSKEFKEFSVKEKIKYYKARVDDPNLTEGQRNYAEERLSQLR